MSPPDKPKDQAPPLSDADREMFRNAVGNVNPLSSNQADVSKPRPTPRPRQTEADEQAVLEQMATAPFAVEEVETGDELSYLRSGMQRNVLKKLKRGQYVVEKELDLHGLTVAEAKPVLHDFIQQCIAQGKRCVRIIHGKGHGSKNKQPILKNKVNTWLRLDDRVLAFCSARANDGGTGAIYVLMKN